MQDIASGAENLGTYTPVQLFAGQAPIISDSVVVASGQNLAKYQVFAIVGGKAVAFDSTDAAGAEVAAGIMAQAVDATDGDARGPAFFGGFFNHAALVWDTPTDTLAERRAAFAGTDIHIGEVI